MKRLVFATCLTLSTIALTATAAPAATAVTFVTDWKAQAEHGGFYEALAEGLYAKRGLNVRIVQGGKIAAPGRDDFQFERAGEHLFAFRSVGDDDALRIDEKALGCGRHAIGDRRAPFRIRADLFIRIA